MRQKSVWSTPRPHPPHFCHIWPKIAVAGLVPSSDTTPEASALYAGNHLRARLGTRPNPPRRRRQGASQQRYATTCSMEAQPLPRLPHAGAPLHLSSPGPQEWPLWRLGLVSAPAPQVRQRQTLTRSPWEQYRCKTPVTPFRLRAKAGPLSLLRALRLPRCPLGNGPFAVPNHGLCQEVGVERELGPPGCPVHP